MLKHPNPRRKDGRKSEETEGWAECPPTAISDRVLVSGTDHPVRNVHAFSVLDDVGTGLLVKF